MSNVIPLAPQRPLKAHLNIETEFMMLVALRERTSARLDELTGILSAAYGLPPSPLERMRAEDTERASLPARNMPVEHISPAIALPLSGLTGAMLPADGSGRVSLIFRGGRDA